MDQDRRLFLQRSVGAVFSTLAHPPIEPAQASDSQPQPNIPRWRGFNLTELAGGERRQRYEEADFAWMAEWGFNFARLPCSYWAWSTREHWMTISEAGLQPLDRAVTARAPVWNSRQSMPASHSWILRQQWRC